MNSSIDKKNVKLVIPNMIVCVVTFVLMLFYAFVYSSVSVVFCYFLLFLIFLIVPFKKSVVEMRLYFLAFNFAFSFSMVLFFVYIFRYEIPYLMGGSDDLEYERQGKIVSEFSGLYDRNAISDMIEYPGHNSLGYVYFLSLIIRCSDFLGGYDTMLPRLFNAAMLGYVSVITKRIVQRITEDRRYGLWAGLWAVFFPIMFYCSAHIFRDVLTLLLLMSTLYFSLEITLRPVVSRFYMFFSGAGCFLFVVLMTQLRLFYVIPLLFMLLSAFFVVSARARFFKMWHLLPLLASVVAIYRVFIDIDIVSEAISLMVFYSDHLATGSRSSGDGLSLQIFLLPQPAQTLMRVVYAVFTPLPVWYEDIERNLLSLGTIIQVVCCGFFVLGFGGALKDYRYLPLVIGFSLVFSSYVFGTFTFRHITQWFPLALIVGFLGYSKHKQRVLELVLVPIVALILFYFVYFFLIV